MKIAFRPSDPIVCTYYFYWYDAESGSHVLDPDGTDALQDHPPAMEGFTFRSVQWHKTQVLNMTEAGIDVILPVYWGDSGNLDWSVPGLRNLVIALEELAEDGEAVPKIGMFFDTTSFMAEGKHKKGGERPDLATAAGRALLLWMVRDFYSLVPPRFRARIDGRPVVWFYTSSFVSNFNPDAFKPLDGLFSETFGERAPYVVREASWLAVPTENMYRWGAALNGPFTTGVSAVGPGYDDSAVPGRKPDIRDREDGDFYARSWEAALRAKNRIVVIETWNEFHEGTDICESREYGRKYIELTRKFSKLFHQKWNADEAMK